MSRLIAIKCPACSAPLDAPPERAEFFCHFCGTRVVTADALRRTADEAARSQESSSAPKPAVPIPEKLHVEDFAGELKLWWRWFSPTVFFLIPFAIAWNGFLIGWYTLAGEMPGHMPGPMRFIMLVFPIGHVAVGLGLIYAIVVMLFNRTVVHVRDGMLSVWHGPIFYPGSRSIPIDDIDQLYCSLELAPQDRGVPGIVRPLNVRLKSGRSITLLKGKTEGDLAAAVEQLVEEHLGIADRRVEGEG